MVKEAEYRVPESRDSVEADWNRFFRARAGDEQAWREVVDCYRSRLTALALMITRSPASAEDVVQETFLRSLNAVIDSATGTVHGYLGTIAYRLAVKEARRNQRDTDIFPHDRIDEHPDPMEAMLLRERDRTVARAIQLLPRDHRDVLLLRSYGGHSYEQIANLLDIPIGTVKSRIFNAVKACRETLRKEGVID